MVTRSKAPLVMVRAGYVDRRAEIINKLDSEHPEYVHLFQRHDISEDELRVSGQELVRNNTYEKGEDGGVMRWRNDYVARIDRKLWEEMRAAECDQSASDVESLYCDKNKNDSWKDNTPGRRIAKPKDPNEIGNIGGM